MLAAAGLARPGATIAKPSTFTTGFGDQLFSSDSAPERQRWFGEASDAGAGMVRIAAFWRAIAPTQPEAPKAPDDPAYNFAALDRIVDEAASRDLDVILVVSGAPDWAQGARPPRGAPAGTWRPSPVAVGRFGTALARRYGPAAGGRVEAVQFWIEPNLPASLSPQWKRGRPVAAIRYRKMLRQFSLGVAEGDPGLPVVTAGLAPYGDSAGGSRTRPLRFWRTVFCLRDRDRLRPASGCRGRTRFDVFAGHAINTSGGPDRSALHPDDASSGDLEELVRTLRAAERLGTVAGPRRHPFWVTEMWWESNPPDRSGGVSLAKQALYLGRTFYLAWRAGASVAINLNIRDARKSQSAPYGQNGIFFINGQRKRPAYSMFRFPMVADRLSRRKVRLWTVAPEDGILRLERRRARRPWRPVGEEEVRAGEVVTTKVRAARSSVFRARVGALVSPDATDASVKGLR